MLDPQQLVKNLPDSILPKSWSKDERSTWVELRNVDGASYAIWGHRFYPFGDPEGSIRSDRINIPGKSPEIDNIIDHSSGGRGSRYTQARSRDPTIFGSRYATIC